MADDRQRWWTFVGYPGDSLPENYRQILNDELHLCFAESPVHDKDVNGDETEKKDHIHFVVYFDGKKSFDQVKEISDRLNCPIPQKVANPRGMVRYLIHIDNPDKAQYREEEILCFGGFSIEEFFKKSAGQYRDILFQILDYCREEEISEFWDLVIRVRELGYADWFDVLSNRNTMFISACLKSKRFKEKQDWEALRDGF